MSIFIKRKCCKDEKMKKNKSKMYFDETFKLLLILRAKVLSLRNILERSYKQYTSITQRNECFIKINFRCIFLHFFVFSTFSFYIENRHRICTLNVYKDKTEMELYLPNMLYAFYDLK